MGKDGENLLSAGIYQNPSRQIGDEEAASASEGAAAPTYLFAGPILVRCSIRSDPVFPYYSQMLSAQTGKEKCSKRRNGIYLSIISHLGAISVGDVLVRSA